MNKKQISLSPPPPPQSFLTKIILILTTTLILTLALASCGGNGAGSGKPPTDPLSAVYESTGSDGNTYILEITEAGRAVYTPKNGDKYELTIKNPSGTVIGKSSGTVTVTVSGSTSSFTLAPSGSTETFIIKIVNTETGASLMTAIMGTIILTDGTPPIAAPTVNPVRTYEKFELYANKWWEFNNSWSNDIRLSDFTAERPVKGKIYVFSLSGTTDKLLNKVKLELSTWVPEEDDWRWVGGAEIVPIPTLTFVDRRFEVHIVNDPIPNVPINLGIENVLWNTANGVDTGERLPPGTNNGDLMATIRNFKISLIEIKDDEDYIPEIPDTIVGNIHYNGYITNMADATARTDFSFAREWNINITDNTSVASYYPLSKYIDGASSVRITGGDVILNLGTPKPEYMSKWWNMANGNYFNMSPIYSNNDSFFTSDNRYALYPSHDLYSFMLVYSGEDQIVTESDYIDFDDGRHYDEFNLSLKKGWNWVFSSYNEAIKTTKRTASVSLPAGTYWFVYEHN